MASIPMEVLKRAAALYKQPGNTWADVVRILAAQGHKHSRKHLQRKCGDGGLLAKPDHKLCANPLCKAEYRGGQFSKYCECCREERLPQILSRRRLMSVGR